MSEPSTRVTEAELRDIDDLCPYEDWVGPKRAKALVAEIRRYRALLLGLAGPPGSTPYCCACYYCSSSDPGRHDEDCLWPELEAEVQAIRAERDPKAEANRTGGGFAEPFYTEGERFRAFDPDDDPTR